MAWLRMDGRTRQVAGAQAEECARAYLEARGLLLVARNYRCRQGEVDLVMRDGEFIAFIEVRLRRAGALVSAAESVDPRKQRRIIAAARHYLSGKTEAPCRFDCVLLDRLDPPAIEWVKSAFEA